MPTATSVEHCQEPTAIRTLLISDVRLYREGLQAALGHGNTIAVVATAASIADGVDAAAAQAPDVIVIDIAMRESLAGVRALAGAAPWSRIVAFAVDEQACDIPAYAEAGIAGYVPCEASINDLVGTIERVTNNEALCSPRVAGALFRRIAALAGGAKPQEPLGVLSRREQEILALIRGGLSNKEIAQKLSIEVATVKNHIHSLLTKLHVSTRAQAASLGHAMANRSRVAAI